MQLEVLTHKPNGSSKSTPILFVHGAWHAAWCWEENFLPYFAQHGYPAYALSLRGHGSSPGGKALRWTSANDYVADVAQIAGELEVNYNTRPILVGHSMGGYVIQKYLETHDAPAAVLLASIPVIGTLPFFLRNTLKHPLAMLKTALLMKPQVMVGTPELVHEAFFSATLPREQVLKYFPNIQNESFRVVFDSALLRLPRPKLVNAKHLPILVLGAENDAIFSVPEVEATARAYRTQATIFAATAHDMMLETNWQAPADKIISWLSEHNL